MSVISKNTLIVFCTIWTVYFLEDDDDSSFLPFIMAPFMMVVGRRFCCISMLSPSLIPIIDESSLDSNRPSSA